VQAGFNTQFAWSFTRLVTLSYFWNFTSASINTTAAPPDGDDPLPFLASQGGTT